MIYKSKHLYDRSCIHKFNTHAYCLYIEKYGNTQAKVQMYISKIKKACTQASVGKCRSTGQTGSQVL